MLLLTSTDLISGGRKGKVTEIPEKQNKVVTRDSDRKCELFDHDKIL